MGSGSWSSSSYFSDTSARRAKGIDDFKYDKDVRAGIATGIHETLDPKKMNGGMRESRDSDEHPESLPVMVIFDVTGSMGKIPEVLQQKLAKLMDILISKAGIEHPQVLVGAVGDSYTDSYPFQIGQFESDNRFDEQLRNIILEGGGGGQVQESYGLAFRFAARNTVTDSFEKRGKKGYLFTMGDEDFWKTLKPSEVEMVFGESIAEEESVTDLIREAQEKWEVFHLFAMDGSYPTRTDIHESWSNILGERFVKVNDSKLVCEVIAGLVYALESFNGADEIVEDLGVTDESVTTAVATAVGARTPSTRVDADLPADHEDGDAMVKI